MASRRPADAAACRGLIEFARATFGGLDILVNNAALTTRGDIEHVPLDVVDSIFAVNLRAPLLLTQAAIPLLKVKRRRHRQHRLGQRLHRRAEALPVLGVEGRADDAHEELRVVPEQ